MIKKLSIIFTLLLLPMISIAQDLKWEFNGRFAFGGEWTNERWDGYSYDMRDVLSLRAGVGVTYHFNKRWSVMPEVEIIGTEYDDEGHIDNRKIKFNNELFDKFIFIHVPVIAKYSIRLRADKKRYLVFGLGPSLNFTVKNNKYEFYEGEWTEYEIPGSYYDKRKDALNGKNKIKDFNIGVQLSVMYHFGHFSLGLEANLGLLDMNNYYGVKTDKKYIYHIWPFSFTYHF